jgi:hypothetical protein
VFPRTIKHYVSTLPSAVILLDQIDEYWARILRMLLWQIVNDLSQVHSFLARKPPSQFLNPNMKLAASLFFLMPALWYTVTAQECLPCSDGVEPFILGAICENAVELMQTLTSGMFAFPIIRFCQYHIRATLTLGR